MRYLSLIAILAALALSAASGTIVWADYAPGGTDSIFWGTLGDTGDTIVWGN